MKYQKFFLSAGHNFKDPGANNPPNPELSEFKLNRMLCEKMYDYLKDKIDVVFVSDNINLSQTISFINSNATSKDFAIEFHNNSASNKNASGTEIFYYGNSSVRKKEAETFIKMFLSEHTYFKNRGVKNTALSFTKKTSCPALLWETGFLSNSNDSDYIVENIDEIAETLAECVLNLFEYKEVEINPGLYLIKEIEERLEKIKGFLK
jgi:N-acetylmuramoyl-L-alanine amidase